MAPISYACRYCKKSNIARSLQGLRSHISQSVECRTRRDEEHIHLNHNRIARGGAPHTHPQTVADHDQQTESLEDNLIPPSDDYSDAHRSKRARVDDVDDDDDESFQPTEVNFIVDYPEDACAGAILEGTNDGLETRFEKIERMREAAGEPAWAPFSSPADWEPSRWLIQSGVSQSEIDKFLKLESVRTSILNCYILQH